MAQDDFVIGDISMDGFQVIRGRYFSRQLEPALTLWNTAISFNIAAYTALNNCESIQLLINPDTKRILIKPSLSKDQDAINWIKDPSSPTSTKLECSMFAKHLFETWGWDKTMRYRTNGKLVQFDRKLMLLFDFNHPEIWKGIKSVKENG